MTLDQLALRDHVTNLKHIITAIVPMTARLVRMVTYLEGLLPIKPHEPLLV